VVDYTIDDFDHITCQSVRYSSGDRGLRNIYNTKNILWEEAIEYGNPMFPQNERAGIYCIC
jgi:hypothetical protein